ncbi:hypothetical protein HA41_18810 [Pantoea conspicua]|uniref:Uncharacterized protein n=2 Tax=Pantoea conspicua TaxID=472705 RepID=A0A1X1BRA5_9GAMM|nr:hypothetical protein HA41_18810 [Pantoea conspicua]
METAEVRGVIMADNAPGKEKKVKSACIIPGILLAGVFLTSVNIFPHGWMGFLPYEISKIFVIVLCFYGGISILKDVTLYFMKGSRQ